MRLTVRREQREVMDAVAEANFEKRIADHLRHNYADSVVKLPDGGFTTGTLPPDKLEQLVTVAIAKARGYQMTLESSIALFAAMMFDVAPNFDRHRLCEVLLGDEEKKPDERIRELPKVLSEKNWEAIREGYDPNAWAKPAASIDGEQTDKFEAKPPVAPAGKPSDPMGKTVSGKTISGKTMTRTIRRKPGTVDAQPTIRNAKPEFDEKTIRIDRKEL
jgi:hypothetical protein